MNYTRTFPTNNYNVYLRASSQARQDVRLDEITSDRTLSNQTAAMRGQFLVPNTESTTRFRYVPLTDAAGNLQTLHLGGANTLRLTANQVRAGSGSDDANDRHTRNLQLNWILFVPTIAPASSGPFMASASPSANSANFDPTAPVNIVILNRGTLVSCPGGIQLRFDGVNVTSAASISCATSDGPGATVSYKPPTFLLPNSVHIVSLVFSDPSTTQSNQWSFTVDTELPVLSPSDAVGGSPDTLFTIQVNQSPDDSDPTSCQVNGPWEDWITRGERQLEGRIINGDTMTPYPNEAAGSNNGFYTELNAVNYSGDGSPEGFFGADVPFPGIGPNDPGWNGGSPTRFAMAATINLQLAAGAYRMGVNSDDGFKVTAGGSVGTNILLGCSETFPGVKAPQDVTAMFPEGVFQPEFDFVLQTNGVYKFRMLMEQAGGASRCEWYWVNRNTRARELVRPLQLLSSASVNGPYAVDATAQIDPGAKTITVAKSGNARFYKLLSSAGYTFNRPTVSGSNIVLSYQ